MIEFAKSQCLAAAADLGERGSAALRRGDNDAGYVLRCAVRLLDWPNHGEEIYRRGLYLVDVSGIEADAAVAAISEGRHPPDSLPGRIVDCADRRESVCADVALEWIGAKR